MAKWKIYLLVAAGILLASILVWQLWPVSSPQDSFDGERAYQDVVAQVAFGARLTGSQAHAEAIAYIQNELKKAGWRSEIQQTQWQGFPVQNILATRSSETPRIILGAHYDSRRLADQDAGPGGGGPVPGANDGASGVAILLELARTLPIDTVPVELAFFDAEDDGGLDGREWIMGSRAFAAQLTFRPQAVIIVDMVGDADLDLYLEQNSDPVIAAEIWQQAAQLGYEQQFIPTAKYSMLDDHTPFLEAGIPAVDIIDFDYPYWHPAADTPDKVSSKSLQMVGQTLHAWLLTKK